MTLTDQNRTQVGTWNPTYFKMPSQGAVVKVPLSLNREEVNS